VSGLHQTRPFGLSRQRSFALLALVCLALVPPLSGVRLQTSIDAYIADPTIGQVGIGDAILAGFSGLFGDNGLSVLVGLLVGWLVTVGRRADAAAAVAAFVGTEVLGRVLKALIDAPRPYLLGDEGFMVAGLPRPIIFAIVGGLLLLAASTRWRQFALSAAAAVSLLFATTVIVDLAISGTNGFDGFPSGHAAGSMAFAAIATIVTWNTRGRPVVVLASAIVVIGTAMSRLYLDAHYPADLLAGWCVAFAAVGLAWFARDAFSLRREVVADDT
jgi:membrane-associated phospholipid phosphatase